jgi:hypothetical protein
MFEPLKIAARNAGKSEVFVVLHGGRWSSSKLRRDNVFACCRFESRSSRRVDILASDMAYGVVRQGSDLGGFPLSAAGSAFQLRLRPTLVHKVGCTW